MRPSCSGVSFDTRPVLGDEDGHGRVLVLEPHEQVGERAGHDLGALVGESRLLGRAHDLPRERPARAHGSRLHDATRVEVDPEEVHPPADLREVAVVDEVERTGHALPVLAHVVGIVAEQQRVEEPPVHVPVAADRRGAVLVGVGRRHARQEVRRGGDPPRRERTQRVVRGPVREQDVVAGPHARREVGETRAWMPSW